MEFKDHLEKVIEQLSSDSELYETYKANIAIQFQDACQSEGITFPKLHKVSNIAADNFLQLWLSKKAKQ